MMAASDVMFFSPRIESIQFLPVKSVHTKSLFSGQKSKEGCLSSSVNQPRKNPFLKEYKFHQFLIDRRCSQRNPKMMKNRLKKPPKE
jgi:hypothetical protein